ALDKVHAEWSKDKRIDYMRIEVSDNDKIQLTCDRYKTSIFYPYSFTCDFRHLCDRFTEVYQNCEIETMNISMTDNADQSIYCQLIDCVKRIRCTDILEIRVPYAISDLMLREILSNKENVLIW
ncbi:hypothetical protein PFISCL1PPCAC_21861, partial [Pristionchus fissidentatus]